MNAPISLKPFESETKSSIWAIDNALPWEPHGADAFGANRHLQNVGDLLQPARSDAVGALLVFLHLLEREAERIAHFPWLIASILRRMRTRRPTCSSMGDGQVLRGEYSEIEQPVPERLAALVKKLEVRPPVSAQRRLAARIGPSLRRRA